MLNISELSKESIKQILKTLDEDGKIGATLPGGGLLHIEENLPYLIVYREREDDAGTERLVLSEASYLLIGQEDFEHYQNLIFALIERLCTKFKSYLVFEIYAGESNSCFTIKAPVKKITSSVKILEEELNHINNNFRGLDLKTEVKDTPHRQKEGDPELLSINDAKRLGAVVVGLEIPPVYRGDEEKVFPVFLRQFKNFLVDCMHKAIYDYVRVHTSCRMESHLSLGREHLKDKVFEIDKALAKIERSYQFLWLVSPANIHSIKTTFFESDYEKVLDYHYRILPIDPDVLKRELYNLRIEDIDDPAMSHIFREKREELDHQITMLNERGSKNFFYNSIRLYKGISRELNEEAKAILNEVSEDDEYEDDDYIDAKGFASLARREFDYFAKQNKGFKSKIHIRKDVNIMMVNKGELYVPADYKMKRIEAQALIQHEVGTHVLTYFNGMEQPLELLSSGLADYDPLQEGLAVMSEYMVDGLTPNRLRTLAGRVVAGSARLNGAGFQEIFRLLKIEYGFSAERSFNITSRIMQGGGFLKDIIYLKGLVELREHLQEGGDYESLLAGKFALKHTKIVQELTERKILKTGALRPSYLLTEDVTEKLNLIRNGLSISKMTT
ncbi:flavohemoglobin expression-modulating QEGLA motif protein [Psychroflexus salinarum]|uniref:Flavohemoglobin expression-modulating QEGLA motif protein n=1 Tax=Psychroflexus salinarum TaxID=546024 RepID=A0ABW3GYN5_9FLAO